MGGSDVGTEDTADFQVGSAVNVNLLAGSAVGQGTDTLTGMENVIGSLGNDTITGDLADNELFGRSGDDDLTGGSGTDVLEGEADERDALPCRIARVHRVRAEMHHRNEEPYTAQK